METNGHIAVKNPSHAGTVPFRVTALNWYIIKSENTALTGGALLDRLAHSFHFLSATEEIECIYLFRNPIQETTGRTGGATCTCGSALWWSRSCSVRSSSAPA